MSSESHFVLATEEQDIEAITFAIDRLEAAGQRTPNDPKGLPAIEIMIETLKARRAQIVANMKRRKH
jgi:hypothetical protein